MANADPYQYALRRAMESGGDPGALAELRRALDELVGALRSEGFTPREICRSLVRTASDILIPLNPEPEAKYLATRIIDDVEQWCADMTPELPRE
jgi:hypothetical protein